MHHRILLATGNPAKQETLRRLVEGLPLTAVTPQQLGLDSVPEESGATHREIACQKAEEWSRTSSMLVIASDGGLVIPALGDRWESRFTHRFAGPAADDDGRLRQLLEIMRPYRGSDRAASWIEAVAIADRGTVLESWELTGSTGVIADESPGRPGEPGFWVFAVWYFPQFAKTYFQLSEAEKRSLGDHWSRLKELVQGFFKNRTLA